MKKILFLASLVTLLMTSCGDSFFDLEPASKVTIDKVYKTAGDYNVAVVGVCKFIGYAHPLKFAAVCQFI